MRSNGMTIVLDVTPAAPPESNAAIGWKGVVLSVESNSVWNWL